MGNCLKPLKEQPPSASPKPLTIPSSSGTSPFSNALSTFVYIYNNILIRLINVKSGASKGEFERV
jgi:hypothetical protein